MWIAKKCAIERCDHICRRAGVDRVADLQRRVLIGAIAFSGAICPGEIEIGFRAVVGDEDLAVLGWAHRARIHVQIGVELAKPNPISTGLQ